jgi:hypothetical protein
LSVRVIKQCWMHGRGRYRKLGGKKDIIFDWLSFSACPYTPPLMVPWQPPCLSYSHTHKVLSIFRRTYTKISHLTSSGINTSPNLVIIFLDLNKMLIHLQHNGCQVLQRTFLSSMLSRLS